MNEELNFLDLFSLLFYACLFCFATTCRLRSYQNFRICMMLFVLLQFFTNSLVSFAAYL